MKICQKHILKLFLFLWVTAPFYSAASVGPKIIPPSKPIFIPYFMNLKSDNVNVRAGPQAEHGIKFTLHKKNLPVKVIGHYQDHRKIQDFTLEDGWVHKRILNKNRYILTLSETNLYQDATTPSKVILKIPAQTIGKFIKCEENVCLIKFDKPLKKEGWIKIENLWGVLKDDINTNSSKSDNFLRKIGSHIGKIFKKKEDQTSLNTQGLSSFHG